MKTIPRPKSVPLSKNYFIGKNGNTYHTNGALEEADREYNERFNSPLPEPQLIRPFAKIEFEPRNWYIGKDGSTCRSIEELEEADREYDRRMNCPIDKTIYPLK